MPFTQLPGGDPGQGWGGGNGSGNNRYSGSGGGGGPIQGAARNLSLKLLPDDSSLIITLSPSSIQGFQTGANYIVYWLSPAKFTSTDVNTIWNPGAITGPAGLTLIQGRQKVCDITGGEGDVSFAVTPYLSSQYAAGGWMYAVAIQIGGSIEYRIQGTNFVPVPTVGASGEPAAANIPTNLLVQITNLGASVVHRVVRFSWTNPPLSSVIKYMKITAVNYWNDGFQRDVAYFNVNTKDGATQGPLLNYDFAGNTRDFQQAIILETDGGGHNVDWYFIPVSQAGTPLHLTAAPHYTTVGV